uniref:PABS domain-containing protein n=1 Tax=Entomoneis paludosa TaxID=265537 RepID=A0A7S2VHQ4_9STRA|mmetsp:Transcript_19345/g.40001  ORF Transcript_19345/g.40001 Transcript_19345/m.40001 type:complete len:760 (+) Transcript_19345:55-2334(+)
MKAESNSQKIRIRPEWFAVHVVLALVGPFAASKWGFSRSFVWSTESLPVAQNGVNSNATIDNESDNENEGGAQQLMVDFRNVDLSFLLDSERIKDAVGKMSDLCGSTLLSYSCHEWSQSGAMNCVALLDDAFVSVLSWPKAGAISLDLFTTDETDVGSLEELILPVQGLFSVPSDDEGSGKPTIHQWLYKKRGHTDYANPESYELDWFLGGQERSKFNQFSTLTTFQRPTILEVPHSRSSFASQTSLPLNKRLFLDSVSQSSLNGMEPYHEALVHPALLAHPEPKRVAIIGGGEGATLREVLKHNTVEACVMLEIDGEFMQFGREHLQEWNDCSDFEYNKGTAPGEYFSCFDDPRADAKAVDAVGWFLERFGDDVAIDESEKFDVVIMDALDPSSLVSFSDVLYGSEAFVKSVVNSMKEGGVFIAQVGAVSGFNEDGELDKAGRVLNRFAQLLKEYGAISMKSYDEAHGEFFSPWGFRIGFMGIQTQTNWYSHPSQVDQILAERAVATKSGLFPFDYIDGATFMSYQYPSRVEETVYCRHSKCETRGFDPDVSNVPASTIEMKASNIPNAGRGVFFMEDCPEGSYFMLEDSVHAMIVFPGTADVMDAMLDAYPAKWKLLENYVSGYGFSDDFFGYEAHRVDPGIATFANHGCNGTNNIGTASKETELTADPERDPEDDIDEDEFFNPFAERNYFASSAWDKLLRATKAGEEVLDNYMTFAVGEDWAVNLNELKMNCLNQAAGLVVEYENSKRKASSHRS